MSSRETKPGFGISSHAASLVRPDGYIAWHSERSAPEPGTVLGGALAHSLGY
jgi:hypothetical protein